jgi:hypothetical protein
VEYHSDTKEGEFYEVLKRRVDKFFRGNEVTLLRKMVAHRYNHIWLSVQCMGASMHDYNVHTAT